MRNKPKFKELSVSQIKAINRFKKCNWEMFYGKGLTEAQNEKYLSLQERVNRILQS